MVDYASMYKRLFQAQTQAIELLQQAQQETEKQYMDTPGPEDEITESEDNTQQPL